MILQARVWAIKKAFIVAAVFATTFLGHRVAAAQECQTVGDLMVAQADPALGRGDGQKFYLLHSWIAGKEKQIPLRFAGITPQYLNAGRVKVTGVQRGRSLLVKRPLRRSAESDGTSCVAATLGAVTPEPSSVAALAASGTPPPVVFNSNPTARAQLFLNFWGDNVAQWAGYSNIVIQPFDQDGDPTTFSSGELTSILEIAKRIADDYSPFNINVTTVDPGNLDHGVTMRVDIGGDGTWLGGSYSGISILGSFSQSFQGCG